MSKNLLIIIGILCAVIAVAGCDPTPQKETQRIKGSREEVEKSWHEFIAIMKTGDAEKVKAASTERGYNSLLDPYEKDNKKRFISFGTSWENYEIRWGKITRNSVSASIGPPKVESPIEFIRTENGWKLDYWSPGM
ncbi:MAG TPA: hypothetical protein VJC37_08110 [Planctomycetota bacterium]|nr:hypothetical protein [Planctomycetota bacterium]